MNEKKLQQQTDSVKICFYISLAVSVCGVALMAFTIFKDTSAMTKIIAVIVASVMGWLVFLPRSRQLKKSIFSIADSNDLPWWKKVLQKILLYI